jgi:fido (protein-threonine AMPylation protein)
MSGDLPIYSNTMLRTGLQFADLARFKDLDLSAIWAKSDELLGNMEEASDVARARAAIRDSTKSELLNLHSLLFQGRAGAGQFRSLELKPLYRGQDCAPPQFIDRSLDNLEIWLAADSFKEIHPIERCALTITRIIDIWPFEFGNLTTAIVFANKALSDAGLAPFFVLPEHRSEFEKVVANSMIIEMQPLINAIYQTVKREMTSIEK